jgi:DNA-binding PadR family transcriptional regulator
MKNERPRKIYKLTNEGHNMLNFTENSLNFICRKISVPANTDVAVEPSNRAALSPMLKKIRTHPPII